MTVDAMVLEIHESKIIYGLLDKNGKCGSGSCEGCKCSTGIKTISLPRDVQENPEPGDLVEIHQDSSHILHFALMIILPVLIIVLIQSIPGIIHKSIETNALNVLSLLGGAFTFVSTSLLIKMFRKKETLQVVKK